MRFHLISLAVLFTAELAVAAPTWSAWSIWNHGPHGKSSPKHPSPRPIIPFHPKHPRAPPPCHPERRKVCYVESHGDGSDDSQYILQAMHACNNGGHVVFCEGSTYTIGTALDLTFLNSIDVGGSCRDTTILCTDERNPILVEGYIQFTNDTDYWQANSFKLIFQNATTFWQWGGHDVNIYGGGTIDGNGQVWYDLYAKNALILRPVLMGVIGLHDSTISDLVLRFSPQYYHFVANSTNVVFDNINIAGASISNNTAKNTDGWDTYRSSDLTIQNSHVNNGDDCVSFKPNSTEILVQNMFCNGSHGISVGSLGQYKGEYDIVENVYVYNVSLHNATDGGRIKVWPNAPSAQSVDLQGGGGDGRVNNITWDSIVIDNVDYAIEVDQCYGQSNLTLCNEFPSPLTITNILFTNFTGKTSKHYQPEIATFACSSPSACSNIVAQGINVVSPNGTHTAFCQNVDNSKLDVICTSEYLGFN